MTNRQKLAFEAGSGVSANELLVAIAGVVLTLAFMWSVWVTFGALRAWRDGQMELFDLLITTLRACVVLLVLGFYIR